MATTKSMIGPFAARLAAAAALLLAGLPALAQSYVETPLFAERVGKGELPPVAQRLPKEPMVVDLAAKGRSIGRPGGEVTSLVARGRDIRYMSVQSYARLVGYTEKLALEPDILAKLENDNDQTFTFRLRDGHRWSDGHPFTTDDFRYYWEDVAHNPEISPAGLPEFMILDGKPPRFEILDERTVRYSWDKPNPRFLSQLAGPRDPFLYRPAHYLKQFHTKYANKGKLEEAAKKQKLKSWAALHNRMDDMFENTNPDLPTLQGWRVMNAAPATRFTFERNPYYHRVDATGQQLPYIDRVIFDVAAGGLMAAKANAGETDLLSRGLSMSDIPILKEGEHAKGYRTLLWLYARGSELALYPNLNTADPVWRTLNRDVRFRRALSLGIDRKTLNNALLFGLGREGNNTILEESALFSPELRTQIRAVRPGASVPAPRRDRADEAQRRRHPASARRPRARDHRRDRRRGRVHRRRADADHRVLARDRHQALRQAAGPHHPAQPRLCGADRHGRGAGARSRRSDRRRWRRPSSRP